MLLLGNIGQERDLKRQTDESQLWAWWWICSLMLLLEEQRFNRHLTVGISVATWHKIWTGHSYSGSL